MAPPGESIGDVEDYDTAIENGYPVAREGSWSGSDPYLLMTGGTTGAPKAVLWQQEDLFVAALGGWNVAERRPYRSVAEWLDKLSSHPRIVLAAPPFMHGAAQWCALSALFGGGTVAIQNEVDHFNPVDVLETVARRRAALLMIAGDAFARPLIRGLDASNIDLQSLRIILSGAVALSSQMKTEIAERLPWVKVVETAGASESGSQLAATTSPTQSEATVFEASPGTVLLAHDRRSVLVDHGSVGWLARRTWVPLAYMGDESATMRSFPLVDGVRHAITGDRARYTHDGFIELLGRDSQVINTAGEKIFAEEVERALCSHADVDDALVVGLASAHWGQEVAAVIELTPGAQFDEEALRRWAGRSLARYKLPKRFAVVHGIVRSPAGKPDYPWATGQFDGAE